MQGVFAFVEIKDANMNRVSLYCGLLWKNSELVRTQSNCMGSLVELPEEKTPSAAAAVPAEGA